MGIYSRNARCCRDLGGAIMSDLNEALREAMFTTSWLWDHLHIEVGDNATFHIIGDAEINGGPCGPDRAAWELLAKAKSAARKAMDWMVNGDSGLKSVIQPENIYSVKEFSNDAVVEYMEVLGHYATAFMMNRKQLRSMLAAPDSLINKSKQGEPTRPTLFGRDIIINDYIDWQDQDIWGLNLWDGGLHLWETEEGVRKEDGRDRVLWDIGLGYKLSSDVTVMRQA